MNKRPTDDFINEFEYFSFLFKQCCAGFRLGTVKKNVFLRFPDKFRSSNTLDNDFLQDSSLTSTERDKDTRTRIQHPRTSDRDLIVKINQIHNSHILSSISHAVLYCHVKNQFATKFSITHNLVLVSVRSHWVLLFQHSFLLLNHPIQNFWMQRTSIICLFLNFYPHNQVNSVPTFEYFSFLIIAVLFSSAGNAIEKKTFSPSFHSSDRHNRRIFVLAIWHKILISSMI